MSPKPLDVKPIVRKQAETKTVAYVCKQCGARSNPTFFANEGIPVAINCWKCLEGNRMTATDQVKYGRGMILQPERETEAKVLQFLREEEQAKTQRQARPQPQPQPLPRPPQRRR